LRFIEWKTVVKHVDFLGWHTVYTIPDMYQICHMQLNHPSEIWNITTRTGHFGHNARMLTSRGDS